MAAPKADVHGPGADVGDTEPPHSPRIGLVLGAGGVAGGAFHAGVLAAIEESTGWDPRRAAVIVGTSAGSVTGAALRAGLTSADGLARAEGRSMSPEGQALLRSVPPPRRPPLRIDPTPRSPAQMAASLARSFSRPFTVPPWAMLAGLIPEGSVSTEFISNGVSEILPGPWPDDPLWICAVRQRDGRRVVFGQRDNIVAPAEAVAASCAIPGFFSPVVIDATAYIDGGLHSPTNADLLAERGLDLDLVIVSSPMSITGRGLRLSGATPFRRWAGALLDTEVLRLRRRRIAIVAFQPTPADLAIMGNNAMDPTRRAAIARQAHASARRRLARADTRDRIAPLLAR